MKLDKSVTPRKILEICCLVCERDINEVLSKSKKRENVTVRHIYSYFATKYGFQPTAHIIIGKDHATVIHSRDTIAGFLKSKNEWEIKNRVNKIDLMLLKKYDDRLHCEKYGVCKYSASGFVFNIPLDKEAEAEKIIEDEILVFNINLTK